MPKLQSGGPRRSSRLDLPRDLVLKRLSCLNLLDSWVGKIPWRRKLAIYSSTLAWKIPWTEEPVRLQSMGSQKVKHNWATSLHIPYLYLTLPIPYLTYTLPSPYLLPSPLAENRQCRVLQLNNCPLSPGWPLQAERWFARLTFADKKTKAHEDEDVSRTSWPVG